MEKVRAVCSDIYEDDRFEIIEKAKQSIIKSTNIESSPDEMKVLDNILYRCWQIGWLEKYNNPIEVKFTKLPNLAPNPEKKESYIADPKGDYIPNLYFFDEGWHVTWLHKDDGDSICDFVGETATEAIEKAYSLIRRMIK